MDIKSVLISEPIDKQCSAILTKHGIKVTHSPALSRDEIISVVENYDALIVRSATQVNKELLQAGKKLKVVGRAGAGVDNIDVNTATDLKITVINAPGANAISACELTCALLLDMARFIPRAAESLKAGKWERSKFTGTELFGKTLAVLGLGRVGREVAVRMTSFGMKVIGYDPLVNSEDAARFGTTKMELEQIWPIADYITIHTPLLPSTRNLISSQVMNELCKPGVKIVNVGRGGLVEESGLLKALQSGRVSGAALDVYEKEPPTADVTLQLIQHQNIIATPHLGASTKEAQVRVGIEVAEQIVNLVKPGSYATLIAAVNKVSQD